VAESLGISTLFHTNDTDYQVDCHGIEGRILTLEHALDQALLVMADLRKQLQVQDLLEEQLAETESFAQIQHKAILSLRQQLQLAHDQLVQFQSLQDCHSQVFGQVQGDLVLTSLKKEELEIQVDHLSRREAQLQHQCLDLNDRCEQQDHRIRALEEQVTDLQEQVLHQVQQLREQETATQHWKGRCQSFYRDCQALLAQYRHQGEDDRGAFVQEFEALLEKASEDDRFSMGSLSCTKVELPSFLGS